MEGGGAEGTSSRVGSLSFATQPQAVLGAPLCLALAQPGRIRALESWLLERNIWGCVHHRHSLEIKGELSWLVKGAVYMCESLRHAAPWTVAHQAPLSMGFSRQEYCSGLPLPSPEGLPNLGMEPGSPVLQVDSLPSEPPGKTIERLPKLFPSQFSESQIPKTDK